MAGTFTAKSLENLRGQCVVYHPKVVTYDTPEGKKTYVIIGYDPYGNPVILDATRNNPEDDSQSTDNIPNADPNAIHVEVPPEYPES